MKVVAYIRVSTETQVEKGYGIEMQRLAIEDYCKKNNHKLVREYTDKGISGTTPLRRNENGKFYSERQALADLMNDDLVDTIIIYDSTRIARDLDVWGMISYEIRAQNMNLISVKEPELDINTKEPSQIIMNAIRAGMAGAERVKINSRLADGRKNRTMQGYKTGGTAPYGYMYKHDPKTGKSLGVVIVKSEAERVREIFKMNAEGKNIYEIMNELNKRGWLTRRGAEWSTKSVQRIIQNPFYKGMVMWNGELIKGQHEKIV